MLTRREKLEMLYGEDRLIELANRMLKAAGKSVEVDAVRVCDWTYVEFECKSKSGSRSALFAPIHEQAGMIGFRSLLKRVRPDRQMIWLVNGQASQNCQELVHVGERGPKLATSARAWLASYIADVGEISDPAEREKFLARSREDFLKLVSPRGLDEEDIYLWDHVDDGFERIQSYPTPAVADQYWKGPLTDADKAPAPAFG